MKIDSSDIAIIGLACRLPGALNAGQFWNNLAAGVESITTFSADELLASGIGPTLVHDPDYVKAAPIIDGHDGFDAALFGYAPREARLMDPQQRLFLELAWETFEDAGYEPLGSDKNVIGVYAGAGGLVSSYALRNDHPDLRGQTGDLGHIGNDRDFLPSRLAYKLNLKGPCVNVQTACSTSLVAIHLACQGILQDEAEMALAGASVVRVPHISGYLAEPGGIYSRSGHCRPFDAASDGTLFGSGIAAVLLKPLTSALVDGDRIRAIIKGTAVANDGGTKFSYTAASAEGQARAMAAALRRANVAPETIGYIECHGTATALGDPVEVQALGHAFGEKMARCPIGSVKSNFGHLEQCAGIAGLIKVVLALEHGQIPPSINFTTPNPRIPFDRSSFFVNTELRPFARGPEPRRAAVNSVGMGGTNAFAVLEEAPERTPALGGERAYYALALSAATAPALAAQAANLRKALVADDAPSLTNACFTQNTGRHHFPLRHCVIGADREDLLRGLGSPLPEAVPRPGKLVFLFSGQGAQRPRMGEALYRAEPVFRATLDACFAGFAAAGTDLRPIMFGDEAVQLTRTLYAQPALFALQAGLIALWESWGIVPDCVIGHSAGEFAAAVAAGALARDDAVRLLTRRAQLMDALSEPGGMVSIAAPFDGLRALWPEEVWLAAENAPDRVVASGAAQAIAAFVRKLSEADIAATPLNTSHAFHSALMEPALTPFAAAANDVRSAVPQRRWISTMTGTDVTTAPDVGYWRDQIRKPVLYRQALEAVAHPGVMFLEIGPSTTLTSLGRRTVKQAKWLTSLHEDVDERRTVLEALAELYRNQLEVRWEALNAGGRRAQMPTYPFEHTPTWIEPVRPVTAPPAPDPSPKLPHPLLGERLGGELPRFESLLSVERFPFLSDHRVFGREVLPTAAIADAVLAAARDGGMAQPKLTELVYQAAVVLEPDRPLWAQLSLGPAGFQLETIEALGGQRWRLHASGTVVEDTEPPTLPPFPTQRAKQASEVRTAEFYNVQVRRGLSYGLGFQCIQLLRRMGDEAFAEVMLPAGHDSAGWLLHPAFLDACLHTYAAFAENTPGMVPAPTGIDAVHLWRPGLTRGRVHTVVTERAEDRLKLDIRVYAHDGVPAAWLRGLRVRSLPETAFTAEAGADWHRLLYDLHWRETPVPEPSELPVRDWCILGGGAELGRDLAENLEQRGARTTPVTLDALEADGAAEADGLLWVAPSGPQDVGAALAVVNEGLAVMRALARRRDDGEPVPRLWLATRGAQGDAPTAPMQAPVWGLARSFSLEYPDLWGGLIDLPPEATPVEAAGLLCRELSADDGEDQLMWRHGRRFALRLAPRIDPVKTVGEVNPDSTVWIAGGLGRFGLLTARALIEAGARHLVLTGRRPPDSNTESELAELRQQAEIVVLTADIADDADTSSVLVCIQATMPPLKGVIHTAVVFKDALISTLTEDTVAEVLHPKVDGAWALHRATEKLELDFFILFSSVLSLWGAAGQAAYATANAFLDALAQYRRARGLPAVVFNWGPLEDMAAAGRWGPVTESMWKARATERLSSDEALEALVRLRTATPAQAAVIDTNWPEFARQFATLPPLYRELVSAPSSDRSAADIKEAIRHQAANVLGLATIDPERPLTELGLDSLLAVTLANRLRQSLDIVVPVAWLLRDATIAELAAEFSPEPVDSAPVLALPGPAPSDPGSGSPWLIIHRPRPRPRARLFCFPFAGGGASTFRSWADRLDADIELVAIEPPGRQTRMEEPPIRDIGIFVDLLVPELLPLLDHSFAVYGHCLGALTMFETVRRLIDGHAAPPAHIFVSGARPPDEIHRQQQFENALTDKLLSMPEYSVFEPVHRQIDAVFAEAIRGFQVVETQRLLDSPDLRALMLPTIRAEFEMGDNYRFQPTPPWNVPITCLTGINDAYVSLENARSWRRFTCNRFDLHTLDSEHFIVVDDDHAVIEVVNRELAGLG
jgi:acyl transferase domain-containing protein/surfactin synthase thioesterase subunit/acyl carrier protein